MRLSGVVLALLVTAACAIAPDTTSESTATPSPQAQVRGNDQEGDRECAEATLRNLVAAVNDGDRDRLKRLIGSSMWGSLGLSGVTLAQPDEAVLALLERSKAGERWALMRFDFNGRGWDGRIHFGLVLRRSGPSLPPPYIESAGKGVLDCPEGRLGYLGVGSG